MSRGVPVRITQGIAPQHSRVGFVQAMSSFGEVVYCRKPPYSGIPGEDYVNIGFATQSAAEKCYAELRAGRLMVEGVVVGVGPVSKEPLGSGGGGCNSGGGGGGGAYGEGSRGRGRPSGRGGWRSRSRESGQHRQRDIGQPSPPRPNFKQRHDERSPSPRTMAREEMLAGRVRRRSPRRRRRSSSSSSSSGRLRGRRRN
mmetsp:Transcript_66454/g.131060  ORF Transcript_66454/g.131060 Transcript_66454/m.131060 type:complete len:199 (+) Transcript_66454:111-707(+)